MRHAKPWIILTAFLLCAVLAAAALAEGSTLERLWNGGCELLFHTDNVTVTGQAVLSLDGEYFKTARLHYVQDGCASLYDLTLLTPRPEQHDRQTGWTIVADQDGSYFVMEDYYPGTYRPGTGTPNSTLLRSSVQMDALIELGGLLVGQIEPLLPEGALTVSEEEGKAQVHIALAGEDIPDMAVSALNLAAGYLSNRWFSYGYDRTVAKDDAIAFENYVTVTQALTDGTVRWALRAVDADVTLDAQGRLTGGKGTLRVESTFWDGAVREVEAQFDFSVTDYGESHVKPFSAEDYGVTLFQYDDGYGPEEYVPELTQEQWDEFMGRARDVMTAQGYFVHEEASLSGWCDPYGVNISVINPDETEYYCVFWEDGSLLTLQDWSPVTLNNDPEAAAADEEQVAAAKEKLLAFVQEQHPLLMDFMGELTLEDVMTDEEGNRYFTIADEEQYEAYFVVRVEPDWRIVYYAGDRIE